MRFFIILFSLTILLTPLIHAKEKGNIQIYCQPKVKIYLDGKYKGKTKRKSGNYRIENVPYGDYVVSLKKNKKTEKVEVHVESDFAHVQSDLFPHKLKKKNNKSEKSKRDKAYKKMLNWEIDYMIPHIDSQFTYDKKPEITDLSNYIIPISKDEMKIPLQNVELLALLNPYGEIIIANIIQSSNCEKYDSTVLDNAVFTKFNPAKKEKTHTSSWISWGVPLKYIQYSDEYKYLYNPHEELDNSSKPQISLELITDSLELMNNGIEFSDSNFTIDKFPELNYSQPMTYPLNSVRKNHQGVVWLKVLIDQTGKVNDLKISKRSLHLSLDFAAIQAGFQNKYTPATKNLNPVNCWLNYKVNFKLIKSDNIDHDLMLPEKTNSINEETLPEMIKHTTPVYPYYCLEKGEEGRVVVKALISKKGDVINAFVGRSSGIIRLDKAAIDAALENKYKPASQNGKFIKVWVAYNVDFELNR